MSLLRGFVRNKEFIGAVLKLRVQLRSLSNKDTSSKIDEPIKFAQSRAARWKAEFSRQGCEVDDVPPYQSIVVSLSVGVFLLYFCYFREENDLDEELGKSIYEKVEGLEEAQLKLSLKHSLDRGYDTRAIEARLKEIELEKQKLKL